MTNNLSRNSIVQDKPKTKIDLEFALADIFNGLRDRHIFITLGWQDITTRYRRSRVGAFWLTLNMLVMITVLGTVFGTIFRAPIEEFLPSLAVGIMVWGFMAGMITEGCESFSSVKDTILQVKTPLSVHVFRVIVRNIFIFGHNIIILPMVFVFFLKPVGANASLALLGMMLLLINITWIIFTLAIVCTRFRDMTPIVQNIMQVMFYMTPIIWNAEMLPERFGKIVLNFNPFFHLLAIVREPIIGNTPSLLNWIVPILMSILGWFLALLLFNKYIKRIAYWL